jgi:hypothetical protein
MIIDAWPFLLIAFGLLVGIMILVHLADRR